MIATAPICDCIQSDTIPMKSGKIVPPNKPMIIRPDTSFLRFGRWSRAREKSMEKMFELPNPTKAIHT